MMRKSGMSNGVHDLDCMETEERGAELQDLLLRTPSFEDDDDGELLQHQAGQGEVEDQQEGRGYVSNRHPQQHLPQPSCSNKKSHDGSTSMYRNGGNAASTTHRHDQCTSPAMSVSASSIECASPGTYNDSLFGPEGSPEEREREVSGLDTDDLRTPSHHGNGVREGGYMTASVMNDMGSDGGGGSFEYQTPYTSMKPGMLAKGTSQRMPMNEAGRREFPTQQHDATKNRLFWSPSPVQPARDFSERPSASSSSSYSASIARKGAPSLEGQHEEVSYQQQTEERREVKSEEQDHYQHHEKPEQVESVLPPSTSVEAFDLPHRLPTDRKELHLVVSQVAAALRTSEAKRRHLSLQGQALRNEQGKLMQQVHALAMREKKLEEHVLFLSQAQTGLPNTLDLLRGAMVEAAKAESGKARREAMEALKERNRAVEERQSIEKEYDAVSEALKDEVARLAGQLAQRAVLSAAQERTSKQWEARAEADAARVDELNVQIEALRGEVRQAEDMIEDERAARRQAETKAEQEKAAATSMHERLQITESHLMDTQAQLRAVDGEFEAERRARNGNEAEDRFAVEIDRLNRRFDAERRALESELHSLKVQLDQARKNSSSSSSLPTSGTRVNDWQQRQQTASYTAVQSEHSLINEPHDLSEFIEDVSENVNESAYFNHHEQEVWKEKALEAEAECSRLQEALLTQEATAPGQSQQQLGTSWTNDQARHDVEVIIMEKVEQERVRLTANFREELNGILHERRRGWEMEKRAEVEELIRECEAEKHRCERARVLAIEELRVRFEEELAVRLADLRTRIMALEDDMQRHVERAEKAEALQEEMKEKQRALALRTIELGAKLTSGRINLDCLVEQHAEDTELQEGGFIDLLKGCKRCADVMRAKAWEEAKRELKEITEATARSSKAVLSECGVQTEDSSLAVTAEEKERLTQLVKENLLLEECKIRNEHEVANLRARIKVLEEEVRHHSDRAVEMKREREEQSRCLEAQASKAKELASNLMNGKLTLEDVFDCIEKDSVDRNREQPGLPAGLIEIVERLRREVNLIKAKAWGQAKAEVQEMEAARIRRHRINVCVQTEWDSGEDETSSLAPTRLALAVGEASRAVAEANEAMYIERQEEVRALTRKFDEEKAELLTERLLEREEKVKVMEELLRLQQQQQRQREVEDGLPTSPTDVTSVIADAVADARGRWEKEIQKRMERLKEEFQIEKEEALREAYDRVMLERGNLMDAKSQMEYKDQLDSLHRRSRLMQGALAKLGTKVKEEEERRQRAQQELAESRQSAAREQQELMALIERLRREGAVKNVRIKELEKACSSRGGLASSGGHELEVIEIRLRADKERAVAEAIARTRKELDTEIDLVMSSMKKRYRRKISKMQAKWDQERQALIATAHGLSSTTTTAAAAPHHHHRHQLLATTTTTGSYDQQQQSISSSAHNTNHNSNRSRPYQTPATSRPVLNSCLDY